MIDIADFKKIEIKIGKVTAAEAVPETDKLIKLTIDFGEEQRTVLTAIREFFQPEYFIGKMIPVVTNLQPKTFRGIESQGMILAADDNGTPVLLHPEKEIPAGSKVL
ncbi:MAG: methionine--tRNA ligase subunit beta [Candidatus Levyibacteriota bacterium]